MLNGNHNGQRTGSGTIVWKARELLAAGEIDYKGIAACPTGACINSWRS
jgi:dihydroxy-acid dehydratase